VDRQRRHREDEASDERQARAPRPAEADGADAAILDLQARAGNRAVTELIRAPGAGDVAVQRDATDGTPTAEPIGTEASPTANTMSIPDLKLSVVVESVQQGGRGAGGAGGSGGSGANRERPTSGEVTVTLKAENLDPRLMEAAAKGRHFDVVTITIGSVTMTLLEVAISSAQMCTDSASLSLNFSSMEFTPGAGGG
jgi:hypothetical protein